MILTRALSVFLLIPLLLLGSGPARAGVDGRCAAGVKQWVAEMAADLGVMADADVCPTDRDLVVITLLLPSSEPLKVEITRADVKALNVAGNLRITPVLNSRFEDLPQATQNAYLATVKWLKSNEDKVIFTTSGDIQAVEGTKWTPSGSPMGFWMLAAALILLAAGLKLGGRGLPGKSELGTMAGLFGLALALRLGLGIWGPNHHNGQGPVWIWGALGSPMVRDGYGPGYHELLGWAAISFPGTPDLPVFLINILASAFTSLLMYRIMRYLDFDVRTAWIGGLFLALSPMGVRFAASEGYVNLIQFLMMASICCQVLATHLVKKKPWAAGLLVLSAGFLAAQAVRIHPVGWIPLAMTPLMLLASPLPRMPWKKRLLLAAGGGALVALVILATSLTTILEISAVFTNKSTTQAPSLSETWTLPHFQRTMALAAALAAVSGWFLRKKKPWLVTLAAALVLLATRPVYQASPVWTGTYDRLFLPLLVPGIILILPSRLKGRLPSALVVLAAVAALTWLYSPDLYRRNTEQQEYQYLKEVLAELPGSTRLAVPRREKSPQVLRIPDYVSSDGTAPPDRILHVNEVWDLVSGKAQYYLRPSICSTTRYREHCDALEQALAMEKVSERYFPAIPSNTFFSYDEDMVRVTLYKLPQQDKDRRGGPRRSMGSVPDQD